MFQQQNAFFAGALSEVDSVALRALAILAATKGREKTSDGPDATKQETQRFCEFKDRFYHAAISPEQGRIARVIRDLKQAGVGNQDITSAFVPAVARQLGVAWERDSLPFSTVTIGSARLQAIVRHLDEPTIDVLASSPQTSRNCLVVVPEGAQHTLGAIVLTSQLRQGGARVKLVLGAHDEMMARMVAAARYDAIMISAADAGNLESLSSLVKSSRRNGANSKVILGGSILGQCSDLVAATETDYVSHDWREALDLCAGDCQLA